MRELLGAPECGRQIYSSGWVDGAVIPMRRLSRRQDSQAPAAALRGSPSGLATGTSSYSERPDGPIVRTYDNCFVMRFDPGGRCREFTEYFIQRP